MTTFNILECIPDTLTDQFDFSVSYTDKEEITHTYTVFDTALFVQELQQHFPSRKINLPHAATQKVDFLNLFNAWKASRSDTYAQRMFALAQKYNPIENYDRMEERAGSTDVSYGKTEDIEHGERLTRTLSNTDTTTFNSVRDSTVHSGGHAETRGIYGTNSTSAVNADTNTFQYAGETDENTRTGSESLAHSGTITDVHSGTDTRTNSGSDRTRDSYTLRAHGNIGVTTSAQMLVEDLDLLSRDIALIAICDFIDRYTYELDTLSL